MMLVERSLETSISLFTKWSDILEMNQRTLPPALFDVTPYEYSLFRMQFLSLFVLGIPGIFSTKVLSEISNR